MANYSILALTKGCKDSNRARRNLFTVSQALKDIAEGGPKVLRTLIEGVFDWQTLGTKRDSGFFRLVELGDQLVDALDVPASECYRDGRRDGQKAVLAKMYARRRSGYKAIGYEIVLSENQSQASQLALANL